MLRFGSKTRCAIAVLSVVAPIIATVIGTDQVDGVDGLDGNAAAAELASLLRISITIRGTVDRRCAEPTPPHPHGRWLEVDPTGTTHQGRGPDLDNRLFGRG